MADVQITNEDAQLLLQLLAVSQINGALIDKAYKIKEKLVILAKKERPADAGLR